MRWFFVVLFLALGILYFFPDNQPLSEQMQETREDNSKYDETETIEGIAGLIGKDVDDVKQQLGNPTRIDQSAYDYKWWIYSKTPETYLQVGVLNDKVVTVYTCGEQVDVKPLKINQSVEKIFKTMPIRSVVAFSINNNIFRFNLSEEDMTYRPLVKIGEIFAQVYIDRFTGKVSSVRFMDAETLVKIRPYELAYRGKLISANPLSQEEQKKVEEANARQILDITNVIRQRHNLGAVQWHEKTAKVAYMHSKDMKENNFFAHESPHNGNLNVRLFSKGIQFQLAAENIAAHYVDGIAAVEGWLNSLSHRETLLNDQYTHLGVGVFEKFYTQNFLKVN